MLAPTAPFVREILTLIRGVTFWRKSPEPDLTYQAFSYVDENSDVRLLKALMICLTLELTAGHLLLIFLLPKAAWPVFWLGLLNFAYLIGAIKIWRDNPILLSESALKLRWGLKKHTDINLSDIETVETSNLSREEMVAGNYRILSFMAEPNAIVRLKKPIEETGLFGRKKLVKEIALVLDKPSAFIQAARAHI